jgi:hypothetical protein
MSGEGKGARLLKGLSTIYLEGKCMERARAIMGIEALPNRRKML